MAIKSIPIAAVMAIVIMAVTAVTAAPDNTAASGQPLQVWLIVDTSPPTKDVADELRAIAQTAIKSLVPGDRLWLISAHADRPRLRGLTTIGSEDAGLAKVLEEIKPAHLLSADIAAALDVVLVFLRSNPTHAPRSVAIVLTDGGLGNNAADRFLAKVREIEALGTRLYCTGLERANRKLLVAGAQGQLRWGLLANCDPAAWFADVRKGPAAVSQPSANVPSTLATAHPATSTAPPPGAATPSPTGPVPTKPTAAVAAPPEVSITSGTKETQPPQLAAPAAMPPSEAEKGRQPSSTVLPQPISRDTIILWPLTMPERPVSPPRPPATVPPSAPEPPTKPTMVAPLPPVPERSALPAPTASASGKSRGEKAEVAAAPTAPGPAPSFSPKKPIPAVPGNGASRHSTAPAPLPSGGQSSPKTPPVESHRQSTDTTAGRESISVPVLPSLARLTADNPRAPAAAAAPVTSGTPGRSPDNGRHFLLYGALAVILILAAFLTAVLAVRRRRLTAAKRKTPDDEKKVDRRELYAQVNGQEIALGPLAEVRRVDIGASSRATIPLFGDGILPRHVLLRRDGEVFRLRNLAHKPIVANGVTVVPRGRARVVLPLDLALTDNVKVALQVRDQKGDEAHEITQKGAQDE